MFREGIFHNKTFVGKQIFYTYNVKTWKRIAYT